MTKKDRNMYYKCVAFTLTEYEMCKNAITPVPTWVIVLLIVCCAVLLLPDEIEIWL